MVAGHHHGREEGSDSRLVHAVAYDGYPDQEAFLLDLLVGARTN